MVVEPEPQCFLVIPFVGSSKPLSKQKIEMEGFFKYKHALLLKGVYRKNSYGNEEQLHLNNTLIWK